MLKVFDSYYIYLGWMYFCGGRSFGIVYVLFY